MRTRCKRTNRFLAIVAVLGLWGACTPGVAQTISNPSFESNSFTVYPGYISSNTTIVGWTTTNTNRAGLNPASGNPFADNGTIPDGTNVAFIQSDPSLNSSLSTVISNLIVGETYKVNFRVNARTNVGGMPNLNVWIDASNIVNSTVTPVAPVGVTNIPYKYFAFDFTAAATNQTMTLSNDASGDQTVLVDNFSIALRNSGWSYAAWSNDASSGVSNSRTYTHAFAFNTSVSPVINGITFTGITGANPSSSGVFSTAGLSAMFNGDTNYVTSGGGGSGVLASNFVYGGAVESITIQGLTAGKAYVATIYSVGFDASGARAATFTNANDRLTVNQDQFGDHNGIRVSCYFTANATSNTLTYVPLSGSTFHTYGFSVYQVPEVVVTNAADSGPGSLRRLVRQADVFTLITFTNTLSGQTILLTNGQITTSNNITIDASSLPAGISLSGNNSNRIFEVSGGATLALNTLTLTNGYAGSGGYGGAIAVDTGGTLTLNNSTLAGNTATGLGGAVFNFAGLVVITNSTLSGNTANFAGAIENDSGTLLISASTLGGNVATNNGGVIDNDAGALLRLDNSTLAGNSAGANGGGFENFQATAIINNSTISTNSAGGSGGGINNFGALTLTNTIVAGNTAPSFPDLNLDPSGTFAGANNFTNGNPLLALLGNYGGPTQTMLPLTGSPVLDAGTDSVTNFLATDQRGSPRKAGAHVDIGAVEYMGSPLVTNTADAGAGSLRDAAVFATNGATITFTNTLSGQTIVLTGGQITLYDNVTIDGSGLPAGISVSGNHANRIFEVSAGTTVSLDWLTLTNGYAGFGNGGAVLVDTNGTLTLNNSTLSSNSAAGGGGMYNNGTLALNNSTLSGNAAADGGGIYNPGALTLNNSTLSGNSASLSGGGINNSGTLLLTNTIVAGNSAGVAASNILGSFTGTSNLVDVNPLLAPLGNYGGPTQTMPPLAGSPAVDAGNDSVTSFLATDQRGLPRLAGAHVDVGAVEAGDAIPGLNYTVVTTTSDFLNGLTNSGVSLRDAAVFATNGATVTFANTLSGQTILLTNEQITLSVNVTIDASSLPAGVTVSGNHANRIFEVSQGTTVTMDWLTLTNGNAVPSGGEGGAILVDSGGTLTLNNSTLLGNLAVNGGGIAGISEVTLTLNNSTLSSNTASGGGGGINNGPGALTVNNSTLSGNSAGGGGGISQIAGLLTLNNSTLSGNSATGGGGGGIANSSGGTLKLNIMLNNSTLSSNSASGNGGGIFQNGGGSSMLNNSTLSGNSASLDGGGIYRDTSGGATLTLNNSTLCSNSASGPGGGIEDNGVLFLTNTIVAGNSGASGFNNFDVGLVFGVNNLTNGNPLLAPLGNHGGPTQTMPPLSGSPAIDAGNDSVTNFLATDQRGFPRLSGAHVDIGAVEVQFVAVPTNPPVLKNTLWTSTGGSNTFQFAFTNVSGADFTALASTNVSLPLSNWTVLGNIAEISSNHYQFTDSGTTNFLRRFYVVVSP